MGTSTVSVALGVNAAWIGDEHSDLKYCDKHSDLIASSTIEAASSLCESVKLVSSMSESPKATSCASSDSLFLRAASVSVCGVRAGVSTLLFLLCVNALRSSESGRAVLAQPLGFDDGESITSSGCGAILAVRLFEDERWSVPAGLPGHFVSCT